MKKKYSFLRILCYSTVFIFFVIISSVNTQELELEDLAGVDFVKLAWGGMLYDNWSEEIGIKIDKTHPSYPSVGKKTGAVTWRCKECHGWDYKGKVGAYATGSHYTGIVGIRAYAHMEPSKILKILKDDTHALKNILPEKALESLAIFVSYGQIDVDKHINRKTKKSIGDLANGSKLFASMCSKCHGEKGQEKIDFKDVITKSVGEVATENPWEVLHKIRWGHPRTPMISLIFLDLKEQLDVLAFCQGLPRETIESK